MLRFFFLGDSMFVPTFSYAVSSLSTMGAHDGFEEAHPVVMVVLSAVLAVPYPILVAVRFIFIMPFFTDQADPRWQVVFGHESFICI